MARGGVRKGAGRKPGVSTKRKIEDYFTEEEIIDLVKSLKEGMQTDPILKRFVAEQLFGKAPQRMELTGKDGKDLPTPIYGGKSDQNI